ncbi:DUF5104 domain-containing protein [[Clostridium] leptum]|nr:DUF5104 domain-containing protein [[Clostridium] leptum]
MKRIFLFLLLAALSLCFTSCYFSLTGLTGPHKLERFFDNDAQVAEDTLEKLLSAIENKDEAGLKELFSQKAIAEDPDLDESILRLFDFFQGEILSYDDWGGPFSGMSRNGDGNSYKYLESTCDVETSKQNYRFAVQQFTIDTANPDNIGISSLYVILFEDTDEQYAYLGDGEWTPGINVVTE